MADLVFGDTSNKEIIEKLNEVDKKDLQVALEAYKFQIMMWI